LSPKRSFEDDVKRVLDVLLNGISNLQVGHEAPWAAYEDGGEGDWAIYDNCGGHVWETADGEYEGIESAQERTELICTLVNRGAAMADAISNALSDDAELEQVIACAIAIIDGEPDAQT
jgi:hypothetical protein